MGQGCPKEWNGPRMPKEIKRSEETQDDMRTDPTKILGNVNWGKE